MSFPSLDIMMAHYSTQRIRQSTANTCAWARADQLRQQGKQRRAAAEEQEWCEEPSYQVEPATFEDILFC
jgi:hypothetical protein